MRTSLQVWMKCETLSQPKSVTETLTYTELRGNVLPYINFQPMIVYSTMVSYLLNQMRYAPHLLRLCLFYLILLMDVYGSCGSHCNKHRAIKLWVNLLSHTFTVTHHTLQWGLENHRLPHFHALPLTHKLHFLSSSFIWRR